jgi:hypothetical protein
MISNFLDVPVVEYYSPSCGQTEVDSQSRNKLNFHCPTYPLPNDDIVSEPGFDPGHGHHICSRLSTEGGEQRPVLRLNDSKKRGALRGL